jgi:plastocyanin
VRAADRKRARRSLRTQDDEIVRNAVGVVDDEGDPAPSDARRRRPHLIVDQLHGDPPRGRLGGSAHGDERSDAEERHRNEEGMRSSAQRGLTRDDSRDEAAHSGPGPGRRRVVRRRTVAVVISFSLVLLVSGCGGGDGDGDGGAEPQPPAATTEMDMGGTTLQLAADPSGAFKFDKTSLEAPAGMLMIELANDSSVPHNVAIEGQGVDEESETVTGESTTLMVDLEPGTYTFYCSVPGHREGGMEGTLTVN